MTIVGSDVKTLRAGITGEGRSKKQNEGAEREWRTCNIQERSSFWAIGLE